MSLTRLLQASLGLAVASASYGGEVADKVIASIDSEYCAIPQSIALTVSEKYSLVLAPNAKIVVLNRITPLYFTKKESQPTTVIYVGDRCQLVDCDSDEKFGPGDYIIVQYPGDKLKYLDSNSEEGRVLFEKVYRFIRGKLGLIDSSVNKKLTPKKHESSGAYQGSVLGYFNAASKSSLLF